jgi:hypothetical protein
MIARRVRFGLAALVLPVVVAAQARRPFSYRGFAPGMAYRDFATRAQTLAHRDTLRCQTMRRTAQVMDCGVRARDPSDSAVFYLSANVIEGKVSVVSFVDSGGVALVGRAQRDLERQLGPRQRRERSMWEWSTERGRRFIRLNWRGRGDWRVISITLNDRDVMDRISRYRPGASPPPPRRAP